MNLNNFFHVTGYFLNSILSQQRVLTGPQYADPRPWQPATISSQPLDSWHSTGSNLYWAVMFNNWNGFKFFSSNGIFSLWCLCWDRTPWFNWETPGEGNLDRNVVFWNMRQPFQRELPGPFNCIFCFWGYTASPSLTTVSLWLPLVTCGCVKGPPGYIWPNCTTQEPQINHIYNNFFM